MKVNALFIQPTMWNKHRFKLFELRDDLALLAMGGGIDEKSEEYTTLMGMLNKAVHETKKFQPVSFLRFLYQLKNNQEMQKSVSEIIQQLENSENRGYRIILHGYFGVVHEMFVAQSRAFYWTIPPMIAVLTFCKILTTFVKILSRKMEVLNMLDNDIRAKIEQTYCNAH